MTNKVELKRPLPDKCSGLTYHNCFVCPHLEECIQTYNLYTKFPNQIIDYFMPRAKPHGWAIFTYINRRSNFNEKSPHHGRCWLTYEQITKATGVKSVAYWIKKLEGLRLIRCTHTKHSERGEVKTSNLFVVNWRLIWKDFRKEVDKMKKATT